MFSLALLSTFLQFEKLFFQKLNICKLGKREIRSHMTRHNRTEHLEVFKSHPTVSYGDFRKTFEPTFAQSSGDTYKRNSLEYCKE